MRHRLLDEMGFIGKRKLEHFEPEAVSGGLLADYLLVAKTKRLGDIPEMLKDGLKPLPGILPKNMMLLADKVLDHSSLDDDLEHFWTKLEKRE